MCVCKREKERERESEREKENTFEEKSKRSKLLKKSLINYQKADLTFQAKGKACSSSREKSFV